MRRRNFRKVGNFASWLCIRDDLPQPHNTPTKTVTPGFFFCFVNHVDSPHQTPNSHPYRFRYCHHRGWRVYRGPVEDRCGDKGRGCQSASGGDRCQDPEVRDPFPSFGSNNIPRWEWGNCVLMEALCRLVNHRVELERRKVELESKITRLEAEADHRSE